MAGGGIYFIADLTERTKDTGDGGRGGEVVGEGAVEGTAGREEEEEQVHVHCLVWLLEV